jgi:polyisoprenoid-binding protein YceI
MSDTRTAATLDQRLRELAGTWSLDPAHTSIELSVRHMMVATVRGRVQARSGQLRIVPGDPSASTVELEIDATSIETGNADRDTHLKSADFLDVEHFPTMSFRSTRVDDWSDGDQTFVVQGELTVRDVTRPVSLECEFGGIVKDPWGNDRIGFTATSVIDRSKFGLTWNTAMEGGGLVVGDRVKLSTDAEFIRPPAG